MASGILDDSFGSPHDKYVQFDFHRRDHLDAVLELVQHEEQEHSRLVLLSGEVGIGRRYFVQAAGYMARAADKHVSVATIDLDGYANEGTTLEDYANLQVAKHADRDKSKLWEMIKQSQLDLKTKAGFWSCAFVSIALSFKIPWAKFFKTTYDLSGPDRPGCELLDRLIAYLTKDGNKLVLHFTDYELLTSTFRRWLLACLHRNDNLLLVFSCDSVDDFDKSCPGVPHLHLRFAPHDRKLSRQIVDEQFNPNTFPDPFYGVLWRYAAGYPPDMARAFKDLVENGLIRWDGNCWYLTDETLESKAFTELFMTSFYDPFDALREELPGELMTQLEEFMRLAVLCGSYVPGNLIMKFMGLSLDEQDMLGDLIDERLVEKTDNPIFEDCEATHPSFEQISVYRFKNRTLRRVYLDQLTSGPEREQLASRLIGYLRSNLPIRSRGIARLFVELSRLLTRKEDTEFYRDYLAWWIGTDEAEELSKELTASVKEGLLDPDALWNVLLISKNTWPPYRRWAVLEAFSSQPGGVPFLLFDDFCLEKIKLLRELARYAEAEEICRSLLKKKETSLGPDHPDVASVLNSLAGLLRQQAKYDEAKTLFRRALQIREKSPVPDRANLAITLANLALLLYDQGEYNEGEVLCRRALKIREESQGPDHPDIAPTANTLGLLLYAQGKHDEAQHLCRKALDIHEKVLGPDHPDLASVLNNLACVLRAQSKYDEAEPLFRKALAINEKVLGPDHPDVAQVLNNVAALLYDQGKYHEAEPLVLRALDMRENAVAPDHPALAETLNTLGALLYRQGKYDEAEPLVRRALEIWENALGPDHPLVATGLSNLAKLLAAQGKYDEAEPLYRRALAIGEKVLSPDHPDVAESLENLSSLRDRERKPDEAQQLKMRAQAIRDRWDAG